MLVDHMFAVWSVRVLLSLVLGATRIMKRFLSTGRSQA